ncbi:39S ribosomal protein L33, mitochondrial [Aricia agestis]|uniref:39S ribosomal protein L33, mitochondrial n=1 Tax=Aricia agestis TaxID=91739 RepID=UPI001C20B154|nr:39S ribosomal protein L33, mitochondrial [Aricia agestis]
MFLTNVLLKKAKSKSIMVMMESVVSGHRINLIRERLADKLEVIRFDPFIQQESLYKEKKKIRSMKSK